MYIISVEKVDYSVNNLYCYFYLLNLILEYNGLKVLFVKIYFSLCLNEENIF